MPTRFAKDLAATTLTGLMVLTFVATHDHWNVWLAGDNRRWAAGFITLFGVTACTLGESTSRASKLLNGLGIAAFVLAVIAVSTGSLTVLSLLVADNVLLWALSTVRHYAHGRATPITH